MSPGKVAKLNRVTAVSEFMTPKYLQHSLEVKVVYGKRKKIWHNTSSKNCLDFVEHAL